MSPYNILSDIKSGRIQVKSMDSATILFFKCQRWDNTILTEKMEELFITKIKGGCLVQAHTKPLYLSFSSILLIRSRILSSPII